MKALQNPRMRFCIAIGAASGIGHALIRGMTANLGPVAGMIVGVAAVAAITLGIALVLEAAAKRSAAHASNK
jgi:hypothetical protein